MWIRCGFLFFTIFFFLILIPLVLIIIIPIYKKHKKVTNGIINYDSNMRLNMLTFICYPKCTTCQKAQKWLDENKIEYTLRNIKEENPSYDELKELYIKSKQPLKKFFNTSGLLYKALQLKDKLPQMSEDEQLKLLSTDGMLVKRPLLVGDYFVLIGFKEKEWIEKFLLK